MLKKTIKTLRIFALVCFLLPNISTANDKLAVNSVNNSIASSLDIALDLINPGKISIKRGEPYDESKDPAMHYKSSGPSEGPQHGYFALPALVLVIAGIFIFYLK